MRIIRIRSPLSAMPMPGMGLGSAFILMEKAMYGTPKKTVKFSTLPDVLIQDPVRHCSYLIPAVAMQSYRVQPEDYLKMGSESVTFVIPDDDLVEEVPPFLRNSEAVPSVLIQHPAGATSYFLTFEQLQLFKCSEDTIPPYGIAFVMPVGMELIEELPPLMHASLQSGESCVPGPICPPWGHQPARTASNVELDQ